MGTAQADSLKLLSLHTVHFINICSKTSHDQTRRNYYDHKKIGIIRCGNMGGTTIEGCGALEKAGMRGAVIECINVSTEKSRSL